MHLLTLDILEGLPIFMKFYIWRIDEQMLNYYIAFLITGINHAGKTCYRLTAVGVVTDQLQHPD